MIIKTKVAKVNVREGSLLCVGHPCLDVVPLLNVPPLISGVRRNFAHTRKVSHVPIQLTNDAEEMRDYRLRNMTVTLSGLACLAPAGASAIPRAKVHPSVKSRERDVNATEKR